MKNDQIENYLKNIKLPAADSHKGQNGKLMIIGGSELFHAASKWSLDIASKFVDMVFYSSVPINNNLIQQTKGSFWNGIVVRREDVESYIQEADCVLIGPGMTREINNEKFITKNYSESLTDDEWNNNTERVVNYLLTTYPHKKWVIDAGALQMVDPRLLNKHCIITPHEREAEMLLANFNKTEDTRYEQTTNINYPISGIQNLDCLIILKGVVDQVMFREHIIEIPGGNPGMTKGGTGDVLAGLIAALYCSHDATTAAVVGSYINKKAGDDLYETVGPYFNASDVVEQIPKTLWSELSKINN